jgi:hypothetical protein
MNFSFSVASREIVLNQLVLMHAISFIAAKYMHAGSMLGSADPSAALHLYQK